MWRRLRYQFLTFLAVLGPGFITAVVDNDAGGIYTYSQAGAKYGYMPLWTLLPITILLVVTQEMCSRMGAVTGKGLSDLIREEFGLRTTFFLMTVLVFANMTNVMANFAGVASATELVNVSRYISVPIAAILIAVVVTRASYRRVEQIFLFACSVYICYIVSGVLVKPDWKAVAISSIRPVVFIEAGYLAMLIGMVGTSVAPWMQFFLQAAVVEKGITAKDYAESRIEVIVGCIVMSVTAAFIIISCAGAIWSSTSPDTRRDIETAADAARALKPFGEFAYLLFGLGLLNASLFAASILPLSTAYTVCEGLGLESGVNKTYKEAPFFYGLFAFLIASGAVTVLLPNVPLVKIILISQILNGAVLPLVLGYMVVLVNKKRLMKEWVNGSFYNFVAWSAVVIMSGLTIALLFVSIQQLRQ
jgi:NRAMP (natural resistance-associated macrophage protein)-like metal ion transporter